MGSINSRPLKAYVRFDGSGRIVAGSLILRKNKPKVGKWKEIPAYECCNPTTTSTTTAAPTTTTSTTVAPTTTTSTTAGPTVLFRVSDFAETVCSQPATLALYYVAPLGNGSEVFTDAGLTTPYATTSYIADPATGNIYLAFGGTLSFQFTCA
jgi:hypothetical protein